MTHCGLVINSREQDRIHQDVVHDQAEPNDSDGFYDKPSSLWNGLKQIEISRLDTELAEMNGSGQHTTVSAVSCECR